MKKCTTCARCGPLHGSHGHTCEVRERMAKLRGSPMHINPLSTPRLSDCYRPRVEELPFADPLKRKAEEMEYL